MQPTNIRNLFFCRKLHVRHIGFFALAGGKVGIPANLPIEGLLANDRIIVTAIHEGHIGNASCCRIVTLFNNASFNGFSRNSTVLERDGRCSVIGHIVAAGDIGIRGISDYTTQITAARMENCSIMLAPAYGNMVAVGTLYLSDDAAGIGSIADCIDRLQWLNNHFNFSQYLVSSKLGIGYTGVNRWFKVDDIAISYIYRIAELYGLEVKVKIAK